MYNNPNDITYEGGWIPEVVVTGRRPWVIETDPTNFRQTPGYRPGIRDEALGALGNFVTGMIGIPAAASIATSAIPSVSYGASPRIYRSFDDLMNLRVYDTPPSRYTVSLTSRPVARTFFSEYTPSVNFSPTAAGTIAAEYAPPLISSLNPALGTALILPTAATTALLNKMGIGELSSSYETPIYEAHPRRRTYVSNDDGNVNDHDPIPPAPAPPAPKPAPQPPRLPGGDQNPKPKRRRTSRKNTPTPSFWRAPITSIGHALRSPINGVSPLSTLGQWTLVGGTTGGAGWGLYEIFDDDNENTRTTITNTVQDSLINSNDNTRNHDGMNISLDSLFSLL